MAELETLPVVDGVLASRGLEECSSRTRATYRAAVERFARSLDGRPLAEATSADVARWLDDDLRGLTPERRGVYAGCLHAFFEWARAQDWRPDNPVAPFRRWHRTSHECRCDQPSERMRRLAGVGRPLCTLCYQRALRDRDAGAPLRTDTARLHRELAAVGLSDRTVIQYARFIQTAERWFLEQGWRLATAAPHQVIAFLDTLSPSWSSRNLARAALTRYWELVGRPDPPLRAIRVPPKPAMVCRALDEDDARRLAVAARARHDRHGLAILLGLYQGMRREEIATTRWDAVSADGLWLTVIGKGAKTRRIPLHPVTLEALAATPRGPGDEWVFPGRFGGHVTPATVWEWIREVAAEAGVDAVQPHQLRHTCLATQNDRTGDLRAVRAFAGHAKPETTSGYTRARDEALRKVSAALDY